VSRQGACHSKGVENVREPEPRRRHQPARHQEGAINKQVPLVKVTVDEKDRQITMSLDLLVIDTRSSAFRAAQRQRRAVADSDLYGNVGVAAGRKDEA
jgi:hypothetical protein